MVVLLTEPEVVGAYREHITRFSTKHFFVKHADDERVAPGIGWRCEGKLQWLCQTAPGDLERGEWELS